MTSAPIGRRPRPSWVFLEEVERQGGRAGGQLRATVPAGVGCASGTQERSILQKGTMRPPRGHGVGFTETGGQRWSPQVSVALGPPPTDLAQEGFPSGMGPQGRPGRGSPSPGGLCSTLSSKLHQKGKVPALALWLHRLEHPPVYRRLWVRISVRAHIYWVGQNVRYIFLL